MPGIAFFGTRSLEAVVEFYVDRLGCSVWLEQPDCTVLRFDNQLLGFCDRDVAEVDGTLTFVVEEREGVDDLYGSLSDVARGEPVENERYEIYQFFADDPEGRTVEVQAFLHPTEAV